ncbi:MAG TPA: type II secretion system F family protein, partial [Magnetospirillaceae bacterium]|nr:type II secretion system F family protein [Magnetospirillaceae bacterium]
LPLASRLLMQWGRFAGAHSLALLAGLAALIALAALGTRAILRRGGVTKLLTLVPGLGERVRIYELSRLYLTLGMLLEGGITVVGAMDSVLTMMSPGLAASLARASAAIQGGTPLSEAFEAEGLTTPISLRMLRVGERSGELGAMLTRSAEFYDGEIGRWIDRFTKLFEPMLMAAIGIVVGAIVVLLYMPIFDLADSLS